MKLAQPQGLDTCAKCGANIIGSVTESKGQTYHPECFVCDSCQQPLANFGIFVRVADKLYCKPCRAQMRGMTYSKQLPPASSNNNAHATSTTTNNSNSSETSNSRNSNTATHNNVPLAKPIPMATTNENSNRQSAPQSVFGSKPATTTTTTVDTEAPSQTESKPSAIKKQSNKPNVSPFGSIQTAQAIGGGSGGGGSQLQLNTQAGSQRNIESGSQRSLVINQMSGGGQGSQQSLNAPYTANNHFDAATANSGGSQRSLNSASIAAHWPDNAMDSMQTGAMNTNGNADKYNNMYGQQLQGTNQPQYGSATNMNMGPMNNQHMNGMNMDPNYMNHNNNNMVMGSPSPYQSSMNMNMAAMNHPAQQYGSSMNMNAGPGTGNNMNYQQQNMHMNNQDMMSMSNGPSMMHMPMNDMNQQGMQQQNYGTQPQNMNFQDPQYGYGGSQQHLYPQTSSPQHAAVPHPYYGGGGSQQNFNLDQMQDAASATSQQHLVHYGSQHAAVDAPQQQPFYDGSQAGSQQHIHLDDENAAPSPSQPSQQRLQGSKKKKEGSKKKTKKKAKNKEVKQAKREPEEPAEEVEADPNPYVPPTDYSDDYQPPQPATKTKKKKFKLFG
mmetsp:Transcript_11416/g.17307  ORF Transcript_11416/g.17307 Transcript_11416/m.17307 type:complete len:609 (-) Transcript_11416:68-1894(-)